MLSINFISHTIDICFAPRAAVINLHKAERMSNKDLKIYLDVCAHTSKKS